MSTNTTPPTPPKTGGKFAKKWPDLDQSLLPTAKEIFNHHCKAMSSIKSPREWLWMPFVASLIIDRLKTFSKDDLFLAADNLSKSDWHRGRDPNSKGKEYCEPTFLYRNDQMIDTWKNKKLQASKGEYLQVGNEYDNIGQEIDLDGPANKPK